MKHLQPINRKAERIETLRGRGYRLRDPDAETQTPADGSDA